MKNTSESSVHKNLSSLLPTLVKISKLKPCTFILGKVLFVDVNLYMCSQYKIVQYAQHVSQESGIW